MHCSSFLLILLTQQIHSISINYQNRRDTTTRIKRQNIFAFPAFAPYFHPQPVFYPVHHGRTNVPSNGQTTIINNYHQDQTGECSCEGFIRIETHAGQTTCLCPNLNYAPRQQTITKCPGDNYKCVQKDLCQRGILDDNYEHYSEIGNEHDINNCETPIYTCCQLPPQKPKRRSEISNHIINSTVGTVHNNITKYIVSGNLFINQGYPEQVPNLNIQNQPPPKKELLSRNDFTQTEKQNISTIKPYSSTTANTEMNISTSARPLQLAQTTENENIKTTTTKRPDLLDADIANIFGTPTTFNYVREDFIKEQAAQRNPTSTVNAVTMTTAQSFIPARTTTETNNKKTNENEFYFPDFVQKSPKLQALRNVSRTNTTTRFIKRVLTQIGKRISSGEELTPDGISKLGFNGILGISSSKGSSVSSGTGGVNLPIYQYSIEGENQVTSDAQKGQSANVASVQSTEATISGVSIMSNDKISTVGDSSKNMNEEFFYMREMNAEMTLSNDKCTEPLRCVQEIYCTPDGRIVSSVVKVTEEEQKQRDLIKNCSDRRSGEKGKCCKL